MASRRRVGIVGYGKVGQFLVNGILGAYKDKFELVFVWNRSSDKLHDGVVPPPCKLENLADFASKGPVDIIVEVAHPDISRDYGALFLEHADYFVGSPTALSEQATLAALKTASQWYVY